MVSGISYRENIDFKASTIAVEMVVLSLVTPGYLEK